MKAEIRADGLHIVGYVNVPGRESRPVITPRGKVIEVIEQRAFQRAIGKVDNIDLKVDHERKIASTKEGSLKVYEDEVGLRAEAAILDEEVIQGAKEGKLKGWSFNMMKVVDEIEERTGKLPLRRVKDFVMTEITLALRKMPVYSSTSIELRAEEEEEVEIRTSECDTAVIDLTEAKKDTINYSECENRILQLKER
ncbi:prohead peptidase. Unknown type peptidase. MEROPS family U35 [Anaerovirgula multivorans]|uniref:Prohead serine protease domain-containing protein n=1 Tax=Anaerovirgula multivorans TaxID=312168 RepID=A0A238ZT29_9FIRM|nr:HK97 family phage prohead protease [Anaerovirgula multivorans]SNR85914.1 prohead peptidase. Unknown type peptidase. MEROPS family U35 [Anaerovirgula multivorans]